MRTALPVALLLVGVTIGCSRSGDFGAFVVKEVTRYGGHTKTNPALPKLDVHWTIKRDDNGFQAFVTGASFASADAVMRQAFGTPKMSGVSSAIGQPYGTWGAVDIGVAIQLIGRPRGLEIVCVRGVRDMGEMLKRMEGAQ
jgi:hypothetical protein